MLGLNLVKAAKSERPLWAFCKARDQRNYYSFQMRRNSIISHQLLVLDEVMACCCYRISLQLATAIG